MKSFIDQIKLLSYGELDYFIVDSNLKVLDCVVENAAILSGSFNPIHHGHRKLLDYCSKNPGTFLESHSSNLSQFLSSAIHKFQKDAHLYGDSRVLRSIINLV